MGSGKSEQSPSLKVAASVGLLFLFGYVDYATGYEFSLFPVYLIPVALVAWGERLSVVVAVSALAGLICGLAEYFAGRTYSHESFRYWNGLMDFVVLTISGIAVQKMGIAQGRLQKSERDLLKAKEGLEHRVIERTEQIEGQKRELEKRNAELAETYRRLEQKTAETLTAIEALREQEKMLLRQNRLAAMGELIGFIAHQWRQPLNTLGLIVQSLSLHYEEGELTPDMVAADSAKAMEVISHMSQTIDYFKNFFSKDKEVVRFKISEALGKALQLVEATFAAQGIEVIVSTDDASIEGYPNEYSQVLLNILVNARDACLERDVAHPRIRIRIFEENGRGVVTIEDNAGGIPPEVMERVFDPYFTTKGPERGTGIGLYMAKTIIEKNMRGALSATNATEGARFRIEV